MPKTNLLKHRKFIDNFKIRETKLDTTQRKYLINSLFRGHKEKSKYFIGYQISLNEDYTELYKHLSTQANNAGDPFTIGHNNLHTKFVEQMLLDYYASLWNAKVNPEHKIDDKEAYWGYALSMGSTEGNLHALYNARDYLKGKPLILEGTSGLLGKQVKEPVLLHSEDTHYSIKKCSSILGLGTMDKLGNECYRDKCPFSNKWPSGIPSNQDGSINIKALAAAADFFSEQGHPIIVTFNLGTTFKGGYDNIPQAAKCVLEVLSKNNMLSINLGHTQRNGYWFHVDGALGASYLPYIEKAIKENTYSLPKDFEFPHFDFRNNYIQSIVTSGHKWPGAPWPCGVYLTKNKYRLLPLSNPSYIGSLDSTLSGSRNPLSPLVMWSFHTKYSEKDKTQMALECVKMADVFEQELKCLENKLSYKIHVRHNPVSLAVRFLKPTEDIMKKYSLGTDYEKVNNKPTEFTHVFCMRHVKKSLIQEFCTDLLNHPSPFPCK